MAVQYLIKQSFCTARARYRTSWWHQSLSRKKWIGPCTWGALTICTIVTVHHKEREIFETTCFPYYIRLDPRCQCMAWVTTSSINTPFLQPLSGNTLSNMRSRFEKSQNLCPPCYHARYPNGTHYWQIDFSCDYLRLIKQISLEMKRLLRRGDTRMYGLPSWEFWNAYYTRGTYVPLCT